MRQWWSATLVWLAVTLDLLRGGAAAGPNLSTFAACFTRALETSRPDERWCTSSYSGDAWRVTQVACLSRASAKPLSLSLLAPNTTFTSALQVHVTTLKGALHRQRPPSANRTQGVSIQLVPVSPQTEWGPSLAADVARPPGQRRFQGYLITAASMGVAWEAGAVQDLTRLVLSDGTLEWHGISRLYREIMAVYSRQIIGIPMQGYLLQLYYRKDVFRRLNLTVPATWEEAAELAERLNGTDWAGTGNSTQHGFCINIPLVCPYGQYLHAILGSMVQTQGSFQGVHFDPATMTPVTSTPAFVRALDLYQRLVRVSPPQTAGHHRGPVVNCYWSPQFQAGGCPMAIGGVFQYKMNSGPAGRSGGPMCCNDRVRGAVGVTVLPGSEEVLDRATNTMVRCTAKVCPYADKLEASGGASGVRLVNLAPYASGGGVTAVINKAQDTAELYSTYATLSHLAQPRFAWDSVLTPATELGPFRNEHYQPADRDRWYRAGFDRDDTDKFMAATRASLEHPNAWADIRMNAGGAWRALVITAVSMATRTNMTAPQITAAVQRSVAANWSRAELERIRQAYIDDIQFDPERAKLFNYEHAPPAPGLPPTPWAAPSPKDDQHAFLIATVLPSVLGGMAALAALALVAVQLRRRSKQQRGGDKGVVPPGSGPCTTLVVTDIQDSTALWEALPADLMNSVLRLHNTVVRTCLLRWGGYESATECHAL